LADIAAIHTYLADQNPSAAARLANSLIDLGNSLERFPRRGRVGRISGTREILAASPYLMTYQLDGDDVIILHVWDGRYQTQ